MKLLRKEILLVFIGLNLFSCNENIEEAKQKEVYNGPLRIAHDVDMYYSETAIKKVKLKTPTMLELKDGNREFPDGIFIEFFELDGSLSSTIQSNKATYYGKEDLWKAVGDVVVKGYTRQQQLNTEELFWVPKEERIYTDRFVTIKEGENVITGTGLESNQNFSDWSIKEGFEGEIEL
ncbi:MAG: LPS export ABC transporter periplasmic protein LptC [Cyclobacteriaceae bacterium]|nr:LPS export ABC transporter periplasmic protein LptC [Cyclobacteriaceae bacterium]